jgi:hypothetical protein
MKKISQKIRLPFIFSLTILLLITSGCNKQKQNNSELSFLNSSNELDFKVLNKTSKTIFVTCFSYIKKRYHARWRWDKSPVYKLIPNATTLINIDTIPDKEDRNNIFGYLAVFESEKDAIASIYEFLHDKQKLDLDLLSKIKDQDKTVVIGVEKYGLKNDVLVTDVTQYPYKKKDKIPELDFSVKNKTGKTKLVVGFVYQNKDNIRNVWGYDKTDIVRVENDSQEWIDVDTIVDSRNRSYVRGYLGVFNEDEEQLAKDATYELLETNQKLNVGRLQNLKNKHVVIEVEKYGIMGEEIDYTIKKPNRIFAQDKPKKDLPISIPKTEIFQTEKPKSDNIKEKDSVPLHTHEETAIPAIKPKRKQKSGKYKLFK